jgi:hypothetical protein
MVEKKVRFLEDDQGKASSMRLMSMISLIASIAFGLIVTLRTAFSENGLYITIAFLIAAFAPKALQKFAEVKFASPKK